MKHMQTLVSLYKEHSDDISCSLLVNPSHTDESWEGWNTFLWIYTLWIYSLSTLENTDENRIFFVRSAHRNHIGKAQHLGTLMTSVVPYSLTQVLGRTKHVPVDIYLSIYLSNYLSIYLSVYLYMYICININIYSYIYIYICIYIYCIYYI